MSALLDQIKKADTPDLMPTEVPEWGVTVYIKQLTVGERDSFDNEAMQSRGNGIMQDIRSKFFGQSAV